MVRIPDSHSGGPGSIPGCGTFFISSIIYNYFFMEDEEIICLALCKARSLDPISILDVKTLTSFFNLTPNPNFQAGIIELKKSISYIILTERYHSFYAEMIYRSTLLCLNSEDCLLIFVTNLSGILDNCGNFLKLKKWLCKSQRLNNSSKAKLPCKKYLDRLEK